VTWLLVLAGVTIVGGGTRAALRRDGAEVNHVVLFSFGIAFYWLLPVAAGTVRTLADQPGVALWYATWDTAARAGAFPGFLLFTLVTYGAFLAGDWLGSRIRLDPAARARMLPHDPRLLRLFLPVAFGIMLLYAWQLRGQLFVGYRYEVTAAASMRGTLSATSVLLLVLCLLRAAETPAWPRTRTGWRGVATDPFAIAYAVSAMLTLSLGGRLYVASAAIMALVYHTVYRRRLPLLRALTFALMAMLLAGIAGLLRFGYAPSPIGILVNLLVEPLFTSFSLLHFLAQDNAPWIAAPRFLLSDLLNLVPSALFPGKAEYLLDPRDYGYAIFTPLGALHSYLSLMINFGRIGAPLVVFALGTGLAVLKRKRSPLARTAYAMLTGWLAFTFFRDPFSVSIVKNMIEFSILVPTLIVWSAHVMTVIAPRRQRAGGTARATP
jgi:hypothetical protein